MKTIRVKSLTEASNLSPIEKMRLFNNGQRRENIKACGDQKLKDYYDICVQNGFKNAENLIMSELIARGLVSAKPIRLDDITLDESDFTEHYAKEIYNNTNQLIVDLTNTMLNKDSDIDIFSLNTRQRTQLMVDYIVYLI